jgi:hypothetical protein
MFKKIKEWFLGKPDQSAQAPYKVEAPAITVGPEIYAYPLTGADTAVITQEAAATPVKAKRTTKPAAAKPAATKAPTKKPAAATAAKKPVAKTAKPKKTDTK